MTDNFTKKIADEIAIILTNNGEQISSISANRSEDGFHITPAQVLEIMQGNSNWMTQFENELDQSFRRVADKALDYWLKNTDKEIRDSLKALASIAEILLENSNHESIKSDSNNNSNISNSFQSSLAGFSKNITETLIKNIFNKESISSAESDRSRNSSQRYSNSRGQIQAKLSKELSRGKRYT